MYLIYASQLFGIDLKLPSSADEWLLTLVFHDNLERRVLSPEGVNDIPERRKYVTPRDEMTTRKDEYMGLSSDTGAFVYP